LLSELSLSLFPWPQTWRDKEISNRWMHRLLRCFVTSSLWLSAKSFVSIVLWSSSYIATQVTLPCFVVHVLSFAKLLRQSDISSHFTSHLSVTLTTHHTHFAPDTKFPNGVRVRVRILDPAIDCSVFTNHVPHSHHLVTIAGHPLVVVLETPSQHNTSVGGTSQQFRQYHARSRAVRCSAYEGSREELANSE